MLGNVGTSAAIVTKATTRLTRLSIPSAWFMRISPVGSPPPTRAYIEYRPWLPTISETVQNHGTLVLDFTNRHYNELAQPCGHVPDMRLQF